MPKLNNSELYQENKELKSMGVGLIKVNQNLLTQLREATEKIAKLEKIIGGKD